MPVHVNRVTTEIAPVPDEEQEAGGSGDRDEMSRWKVVDRVRRARNRIESEKARTRAEGFSD